MPKSPDPDNFDGMSRDEIIEEARADVTNPLFAGVSVQAFWRRIHGPQAAVDAADHIPVALVRPVTETGSPANVEALRALLAGVA
jgi:hypothetical protein